MAANYLTTLIGASEQIAAEIGLDGKLFRAALAPILRATLENTIAMGPKAALTGPVARGDNSIVQSHLQRLQDLPAHANDVSAIYELLAEYTKKHLAGQI
jgi:predicted short-subunit dehydrogenase-like oxidoreductase (DUF2520 family)